MTARQALIAHLEKLGVRQPGDPSPEVYRDPWLRMAVAGRRIPVFPVWGFLGALALHDLHHLVTGYGTTLRGECEIAGWELGSGGCAWRLHMWVDRLSTFAFGLLAAPAATLRALRRGLRHRNLYGLRTDAVLAMDFDEVSRFVGVGSMAPPA